MNPIVLAAIANATGVVIVAIINVIGIILHWRLKKQSSTENSKRPGRPNLMAGARPPRRKALRPVNYLGIFFLVGLIVSGSVGAYEWAAARPPRISISDVPVSGAGGATTTASISGVVKGKLPAGVRVVVYAFASGQWYVQPDAEAPFTLIAENGAWTTRTYLGSQYAALLVGPGFAPSPTAPGLPSNEDILAFTRVAGR